MPPQKSPRITLRRPLHMSILYAPKQIKQIPIKIIVPFVAPRLDFRLDIVESFVDIDSGELEFGCRVQGDVGLRGVESEVVADVGDCVEGRGGVKGDGFKAGERSRGGNLDL